MDGDVAVDVVTYFVLMGAYYAIDFYRRLRERELTAATLEAGLHEARLAAAPMELSPHFLFKWASPCEIGRMDPLGAGFSSTGYRRAWRPNVSSPPHADYPAAGARAAPPFYALYVHQHAPCLERRNQHAESPTCVTLDRARWRGRRRLRFAAK